MITLPIRLRLTAWYFAILAMVLSAFGVSAYLAMRHSIRKTVDEELQIRAEGVHQLIERNVQRGAKADLPEGLREHTELRAGGALLQVADGEGTWLYRSKVMSDYGVPKFSPTSPRITEHLGDDVPLRIWNQAVNVQGENYYIQSAFEMDDFYEALYHFELLLYVAIPSLLICAALGGYWISGRALAPVDQITKTARTVSAQNLSSRLIVPNTGDELQRLSETLNGMLDRLEGSFRKITQFTADASHELRTPVAVMRTRAELSLRKARSADEYRDVISEVLAELEKTSSLIEQLMFLARADSGSETLNFTNTNVTEVLREACHQGSALAEAKQIGFQEQIAQDSMWVRGDAGSLRRLFLILIDNAVKYTPANGQVEVSLQRNDGYAIAQVKDTGIGIAESDLPNVFERFYRADKARTRELGGVGLGLSIGRWITEVHAGTIEVQSAPGRGSVFQIRLPITHARV
ncbi:MAG TPA: ATP-binding protein [Candidatus Acidoferrales bacterium]|jgi:heavy metal sensor kinase|nr:ATP-binding protein [Candidatus Acidoferrales bacterium]